MPAPHTDATKATGQLVLVIDDDGDAIEINTAARISAHSIPIATISTGYSEPMESVQRRWADQIVTAVNSYDAMREVLEAAHGYMQNALIDLQTGTPKKTTMDTLRGGIALVSAALSPRATGGAER